MRPQTVDFDPEMAIDAESFEVSFSGLVSDFDGQHGAGISVSRNRSPLTNFINCPIRLLMLRIAQSLTIDEIYSLKMVIWDFKDVTSMTLRDSDGARSAHFEKQLLSFIARSVEFSKQPGSAAEHSGKDVLEFLNSLELLCVRLEDSVVRDIFAERLTGDARSTPPCQFGDPFD